MTRICSEIINEVIERKVGVAARSRRKCTGFLRLRFLSCTLCGLVVSACTLLPPAVQDPTKYYVLTSPDASSASNRSSKAVHVGLRSIELPGYLRSTKTMVVRAGANEIRYQDYARWAEPLDVGLTRVLKDELLRSDAIDSVERPPYVGDATPKYEIALRIFLYEGALTSEGRGSAQLVANYEITALQDRRVILEKTFTAPTKSWDGKDYSALARLLSENAANLADEIAASLPK